MEESTNNSLTNANNPPPQQKHISHRVLRIGLIFFVVVTILLVVVATVARNSKQSAKPENVQQAEEEIEQDGGEKDVVEDIPQVWNTQVGIYAYKSNAFSELTSFPASTRGFVDQPILSKVTADGNVYYLYKNKLYQHNLQTKKSTVIHELQLPEKREITSLHAASNGKIYLLEEPKYFDETDRKYLFREIDPASGKQTNILTPPEPDSLSGYEYLFSSGNVHILASRGGDVCMGYGTVYRYVHNAASLLVKIGDGCSPDPRLIGFLEKKNALVLLSVTYDGIDELTQFSKYVAKDLYLLDVLSDTQTKLFSINTLPGQNHYVTVSSDNEDVLVITNQGAWILNLDSKQVKKISDKAYDDITIASFDKNFIFFSKNDQNNNPAFFYRLDIATRTEVKLQQMVGKYTGHYQNTPLFFRTSEVKE